MKLLFVASDSMEFTGILANAQQSRTTQLGVGWARSARLGEHEVLLTANGAGGTHAAAAFDAARREFEPEAVISTGFCGALAPELKVADVVVGTAIEGRDQRFAAQLLSGATSHRRGVVCSVDRVVQTAEEKSELHESGAIAVEMEAAGIAERAARIGVPFFCVRAVTDLAGETLANDFNAALRSDGHFATMLLLRGVLRRPPARLSELIRLRYRCAQAARVLGDFFANCRF